MSIENKLTTIAENTNKIYAQGYTDGEMDMQEFAYNAGYDNAMNEFWENYQKTKDYYGYPASFYIFGGICWNDDTFYPKHDIVGYGSTQSVFAYNGCTNLKQRLEECGVKIIGEDKTGITNLNQCFQGCNTEELPPIYNVKPPNNFELTGTFQACKNLKTVPYYDFFSKCVKYQATFNACTALETVEGIDFSSATTTTNAFLNCTSLKNIIVYGDTKADISFAQSNLLTDKSIKSIIDSLHDYSAAPDAHTITLHADVKNKLNNLVNDAGVTYAQIISNKGWKLA